MARRSAKPHPRCRPHEQEINRWRAWAETRRDEAIDIAQQHLRACQRCRECGDQVKLTETICPNCGANDPVRVPMGVPAVLGVAVVLALCTLITVL